MSTQQQLVRSSSPHLRSASGWFPLYRCTCTILRKSALLCFTNACAMPCCALLYSCLSAFVQQSSCVLLYSCLSDVVQQKSCALFYSCFCMTQRRRAVLPPCYLQCSELYLCMLAGTGSKGLSRRLEQGNWTLGGHILHFSRLNRTVLLLVKKIA